MELYELFIDEPELPKRLDCPVNPDSYRELARFWIFGRGHHEKRVNHPQYMGEYAQDHAPIHHQFQAVGHAVRATLYYTGVTREAMLDGDRELLSDSLRLWENVETRKMHINGGIGATHFEEKFGMDYDLINNAYLETCATAGLIFWAESLSRATGNARFFQTVERALYNLMLSSVSAEGTKYFYRNPLLSDGSDHRWAWNGCPCCPPMIHKFFGMFDRLIYAQDDNCLYVNLFTGGKVSAHFPWGSVCADVKTDLPWKGTYSITVTKADRPFLLKIRVPYWQTDIRFSVNGTVSEINAENGYASFRVCEGDVISFSDSLPVVRTEAHPYVSADRGRIAITRGPLVYCVEGTDNMGETQFTVSENPEFVCEERCDLLGGIVVIHGKKQDESPFTAVPLYAWDNRAEGKMDVWLKQNIKTETSSDSWDKRLYRPYQTNK